MMNYNQGNVNALMTMLQHHARHIITYSGNGLNRVLIATKYKEIVDLDDMNTDWYDHEENVIFQMNAWNAISDNEDAFVKVDKIAGVDLALSLRRFGDIDNAYVVIYRTTKAKLEKALRSEIRGFMHTYGV